MSTLAEKKRRLTDLANQIMSQHGLTDQGWTLQWTQSMRAFGVCLYLEKVIGISEFMLEHEPWDKMVDTLNHEIAHALTPGAGHGLAWKIKAMELGAKPFARDEVSEKTKAESANAASWVVVCPKGKVRKSYLRKPPASAFKKITKSYIPGEKQDTLGKLQIITIEEHRKRFGETN